MHKYRLERRKLSRSLGSLVSWEAVSDELDPLDVSASDLQLQVMQMRLCPLPTAPSNAVSGRELMLQFLPDAFYADAVICKRMIEAWMT